MIAWDWLGLYAVIGALAGLGAGLFGIGGGAIMTPALLLSFRSAGVPEEPAIYMAVAASLATIIFTQSSSARGALAPGRRRCCRASVPPLVLSMAPGMLRGGAPGAANLLRVKATLRSLDMELGEEVLAEALQKNNAAEVRSSAQQKLEQGGVALGAGTFA